jgi:hypothetical protein
MLPSSENDTMAANNVMDPNAAILLYGMIVASGSVRASMWQSVNLHVTDR